MALTHYLVTAYYLARIHGEEALALKTRVDVPVQGLVQSENKLSHGNALASAWPIACLNYDDEWQARDSTRICETSAEPGNHRFLMFRGGRVESTKRAEIVRNVAATAITFIKPTTRIDVHLVQARKVDGGNDRMRVDRA
ncbi:hypothetical protein ACVWWJ_003186 [Luteibacter sp. HA06]